MQAGLVRPVQNHVVLMSRAATLGRNRRYTMKSIANHRRAQSCAALSGLVSMVTSTQGSGSRCRGILHPGLLCAALSALLQLGGAPCNHALPAAWKPRFQ